MGTIRCLNDYKQNNIFIIINYEMYIITVKIINLITYYYYVLNNKLKGLLNIN